MVLTSACAGRGAIDGEPRPADDDGRYCPAEREWDGTTPGLSDAHRLLDTWLASDELAATLDTPLLQEDAIASHNAAMFLGGPATEPFLMDVSVPLDMDLLLLETNRRLAAMRGDVEKGRFFLEDGSSAANGLTPVLKDRARLDGPASLHIATGTIPVRCAPVIHSFYTANLDRAFDRNNCSSLHDGEPFAVLDRRGDLWLIRAAYTLGWIDANSRMTPAVEPDVIAPFVHGHRARVVRDAPQRPYHDATVVLLGNDDGTNRRIAFATDDGVREMTLPVRDLAPMDGPLTRRAILTRAFSMLGEPYGWGGREGFRDCSRFLMDTFASVGVMLPRHSGAQQHAGTFSVDVNGKTDREKLQLLDAANQQGVVILHFKGHIMLYLGRNEVGEPMALHAYAEYLEPCADGTTTKDGGHDTLVRVHQVDVSTLELGKGTARRSFLERLDRLTVVGGRPGPALEGLATYRPALPVRIPDEGERCEDDDAHAILSSPYHAHTQGPTRLIFGFEEDPGDVTVAVRGPDGRRIGVEVEREAGPPFSALARVPWTTPGVWRVAIGDGDRVLACRDIRVRSAPAKVGTGSDVVWQNRNAWSLRYENLYSIFVRELMKYPYDDGRTWQNFQSLVRVEERNILFDYYGGGDEEFLALQPDCADFPYMMRAYFAWKMGLPFGYRSCNRGREGRPPTCGDVQTNLQERAMSGPAEAFNHFGRRVLMSAVHSGNGRTRPQDDATDLYPVALDRDGLRPGVVYADPDGHVMMIARWIPQPLDGYGVLVAADAQPDGTIALRRFWRGTFLFRAETDSVGSGFKAFRPLLRERDGSMRTPTNDELRDDPRFLRYSMQQYEGTADDFYDRMDALINPRPLDATAVQRSLIDALESSVVARVHSVKLGVDHMQKRGWPTVAMPKGYSIFETSGPWEDFATPSRDMRLLAAIDATMDVEAAIRRTPAHFGLTDATLEAALTALRQERDAELAARTFTYERSDGSTWTVSLASVVARKEALEVAYNLNDCPELRWGAEEASEEASTCTHRANREQRERMESYRTWFAERRRPSR